MEEEKKSGKRSLHHSRENKIFYLPTKKTRFLIKSFLISSILVSRRQASTDSKPSTCWESSSFRGFNRRLKQFEMCLLDSCTKLLKVEDTKPLVS